MNKIKKLDIFYHQRKVGTLALTDNNKTAFEYDNQWLIDGFSISPFSLPLRKGVFIPDKDVFDGLFGVFADSLPDGWGRLLVDRLLIKQHQDPMTINSLTRLAIVGNNGMGALEYEPHILLNNTEQVSDLDVLASECKKILNTEYSNNLDELFNLGGSSGGARPKILTKINGEDWIVKFPSSLDNKNIGKQEYDYAMCAKKCGLDIPKIQLFPSKRCKGYFGIKRFDRSNQGKVFMISVSAILETSHRIPNLDYDVLMKLIRVLTNNHVELEKMFRIMCFNVFAHNRDDHSKNFSFLYDEDKKSWRLSPSYDLTYSNSIGGEHATCVNGNGIPTKEDILVIAKKIGMSKRKATLIMDEIEKIVLEDLHSYFC